MLHPSVDTVLLQCWGAENGERVPGWQKMLLKATMPLLKPFLAMVFKFISGQKKIINFFWEFTFRS